MAVSSTCCLKLSPPPPPPPPPPGSTSKTTAIAWPRKEERSWRRQCAVGVACLAVVMSLEMGNLTATAEDLAAAAAVGTSGGKAERWSDKRMCPAWRLNSLETIVPENLPRPSARRRWEAVTLSALAPPLTASAYNCFSM